MRYLILIMLAGFVGGSAHAQGVKDPSTPSHSVIIVNPPQQPLRPTAVPNIPPQANPLPLRVRRARQYRTGRR